MTWKEYQAKKKQFKGHSPFSSQNMIAVYTVLSILKSLKKEMGLEAMLEYMEGYLRTLDQCNPDLKKAVAFAVGLMDMEKLYNDMIN